MTLHRLPLLLLLFGLASASASPVISEFLASSSGASVMDEDGEPSDWIEIYNPDDVAVNLAGHGLSDTPDRTKFVFPEVMLAAKGYLLVHASGKDRREPGAALHTSFQLDRSGEYLALTAPDGTNLSTFDPEYPGQREDVSYGIVGSDVSQYATFLAPTPGAENTIPPPIIESTDYFPKPADPNERLTVTAKILETGAPVQEVRLLSRVMFKNEVQAVMTDTGEAPDEVAGDGVYTAQISNRTLFGLTFKPGHLVRWAIEVDDAAGNQTRFPSFPDEESEEYTGTVLAHDAIETKLNVFHWFIEDPKRAESAAGIRGACLYNGELYDNVFYRLRGGTARSWPKKSFKVEFAEDHHFKFSPDFPRVDEFNLNATYTDKSYARAILTTELHQDSGTPSPHTFPLRVHQNGEFYSVALFVEQCDRDFLRRSDLDPDGSYYKANPGSTYASIGSFEKKTRREETKADISAFIAGLKLKGKDLENFLFDNADIPAQINFMAGVAITQNIDDSDKNHFLYRDTEGSGEWFMTPWDLDLTFGPDALNTDRILANEERRGASNPNAVHPFIGSRKFPLHAGKTNEYLDRMFTNGRTKDMFIRRLRTLHDEFLATDYFDKRLDELVDLFAADTIEDNEKWGSQSHFPGAREQMVETVERIKTEYLIDRRDFFERGGLVDIPSSMPEEINFTIETVEFAPASGNQAEEYIRLKNPNRFAVDLTGWRVEGAVEHTFRPGTVLPAGSLFAAGRNELYVVKDAAAFRQRSDGPSGNQGLFIQGNYRGSLSSLGEEIRLVNAQGELIVSETYEGDPSDWQKHLRITEFLAEPEAANTEFIELTNTGDAPLELAGLAFTQGIVFTFDAFTLAPAAHVLVVQDEAAFEAAYGTGLPIAGTFAEGTRLNNSGETIKLEDPNSNTISEFRYRTESPWPVVEKGHSYVFDRSTDGLPEDATSWAQSEQANGAPNAADSFVATEPTEPTGNLISETFGSDHPAITLERQDTGRVQIQMAVSQSEGRTFTLETSTDLQQWAPSEAAAVITDGTLTFDVLAGDSALYLRTRVTAGE